MSLLDNASLLLTPNSYKEGKLYSVIPSNGNGDFTAIRATTATRVNSSGLVDLVPYNLVRYSEMFADASWSKFAVSITANTTTAPDGTLTADSLIEDNANSAHFTSINTTSAFGTYTASIYAKPNGRNWMYFNLYAAANSGAWFDVQNGVVGLIQSNITSATITAVGNGWYRCTITGANVSVSPRVAAYTSSDNNVSSYAGNGTSGLFIWGAQLVEGTSARDYLRTETRLNIPRLDYSLGGCPNILLEPQRTNLALQSSSFDSATWVKIAATISANSTISPSGVADADKIVESSTGPGAHFITQATVPNITGFITASFYVKKAERNWVLINVNTGAAGSNVYFNIDNGTIGTITNGAGSSSTTASIENAGNGWYRCIVTINKTSITTGNIELYLATANGLISYTGNGASGLFLWGAQLEAGAYSTSFIPTTTASVTRNADSITRSNIFTNGLITAAGGTWFVELRNDFIAFRSASSGGIFINTGTASNTGNGFSIRNGDNSTTRFGIGKFVGGVFTPLFVLSTSNAKIAIKWDGTTADVFVNGVKVVAATSFTPIAMENLIMEGSHKLAFINEMALFPTPLTDAQCLALTA